MKNTNKPIINNIFNSQIKDSKSGWSVNIIKSEKENKSDSKQSENK